MSNGNGSSNTAMVMIFVITVLAAGVGFFLFNQGYFGGGSDSKVDITIEAPEAGTP